MRLHALAKTASSLCSRERSAVKATAVSFTSQRLIATPQRRQQHLYSTAERIAVGGSAASKALVQQQKQQASSMVCAAAASDGEAGPGDFVEVHYTGTLNDGSVFDSSRERDPLPFTVGGGQLIKGFDSAVTGMKVGETRKTTIPPADAYGEWKAEMVVDVPKDMAPEGLKEGDIVRLSNGMRATVKEVSDAGVKIDANHELAGKELTFELELLSLTKAGSAQKATFGMGCFWGPELRFQRVPGVISTSVGYSNGSHPNPTYEEVCSGTTGHTEVVQMAYDPSVVTYKQLLEMFWDNHDPTTKDRQGNDSGTQYRSAIYTHTPEQMEEAKASMEEANKRFGGKVTTELAPLDNYHDAEDYHQQYLSKGGRSGSAQSPAKGCNDPIRCYG